VPEPALGGGVPCHRNPLPLLSTQGRVEVNDLGMIDSMIESKIDSMIDSKSRKKLK
jgi:hypothetical protein